LRFVQFVLDCALGAVRLATETLVTAEAPQPREKIDELHALLTTQGGLTHLELDEVGKGVRAALTQAFSDRIGVLAPRGGVTLRANWVGGEVLPEHRQTFRLLDPQQMLHVVAETAPPAAANVSVALGALVSRERDEAQAVLVYQPNTTEELVFALGELHPSLTLAAKQRLESLADRVLGRLIAEVKESAAASLRQQGYGPPS
jgi:hypothetical protein